MTGAAAIAEPTLGLTLTPFQERVLAAPEEYDLSLTGGRGGGKSYALAMLVLRHGEQYGARSRALYVRRTHAGCEDFIATCRTIFGAIYGSTARFNANEGLWKFPTGATLEINQTEGEADFAKYQGRSFSLLIVDEAAQYPTPEPLDLLRSCLRAPAPLRPRYVEAANPGNVGHQWVLKRRKLLSVPPWVPYVDEASGRTFINAPSTYRDNPFLDEADYARQIAAACATDEVLWRAWDRGDWAINRGSFFATVLDEHRVMTERWPENFEPRRQRVQRFYPGGKSAWETAEGWQCFLSHDYGASAPSVTFVAAESPGIEGPDGRWYPRGSIVLVDELATNEPNSLTAGMGYTIDRLADEIKDLATRWGIKPEGVADDAVFSRHGHKAGSISDEFRRCGVFFVAAKKGERTVGWERMRQMLADAGKPDKPGLYASRNCSYFWETIPTLAHDPRRVEDLDTRGPDHAADAARYALLREPPPTLNVKRLKGF